MRHEVKTIRFTCDGIRRKEDRDLSCPNTMLLTGTGEEIRKQFHDSGWKYVSVGLEGTGVHECPMTHIAQLPNQWKSEGTVKDGCV